MTTTTTIKITKTSKNGYNVQINDGEAVRVHSMGAAVTLIAEECEVLRSDRLVVEDRTAESADKLRTSVVKALQASSVQVEESGAGDEPLPPVEALAGLPTLEERTVPECAGAAVSPAEVAEIADRLTTDGPEAVAEQFAAAGRAEGERIANEINAVRETAPAKLTIRYRFGKLNCGGIREDEVERYAQAVHTAIWLAYGPNVEVDVAWTEGEERSTVEVEGGDELGGSGHEGGERVEDTVRSIAQDVWDRGNWQPASAEVEPGHSTACSESDADDDQDDAVRAEVEETGEHVVEAQAVAPTARAGKPRDPRLPAAGTTLRVERAGKVYEILVGEAEFHWNGKRYTSLSTLAKEACGQVWNGYLWAGLIQRSRPAGEPRAPRVPRASAVESPAVEPGARLALRDMPVGQRCVADDGLKLTLIGRTASGLAKIQIALPDGSTLVRRIDAAVVVTAG